MGLLDALPAPSLRGFTDKLGERLIVEPDAGVPFEALCLARPVVTAPGFEAALAQAAAAVAGLQSPGLQNPPSVERVGPDGRLALVTGYTPGRRLSALLVEHEAQGTRITTSSVLHIIREVLSSLRAVHGHAPGSFHGTVGPERVLLTRDLKVVLTEHALGQALSALPRQSASNIWIRFGLAVPDIDGFPSFGPLTDQVQVGLLGLAMLLGRPVAPDEYPGGVRRLLNDARETDLLGDVQPVGAGLRAWLDRLLLLSSQGPFSSIAAAERALADLLSDDSGYLAVPVGLEVTAETLTAIPGRARPAPVAPARPSPDPVPAPVSAGPPASPMPAPEDTRVQPPTPVPEEPEVQPTLSAPEEAVADAVPIEAVEASPGVVDAPVPEAAGATEAPPVAEPEPVRQPEPAPEPQVVVASPSSEDEGADPVEEAPPAAPEDGPAHEDDVTLAAGTREPSTASVDVGASEAFAFDAGLDEAIAAAPVASDPPAVTEAFELGTLFAAALPQSAAAFDPLPSSVTEHATAERTDERSRSDVASPYPEPPRSAAPAFDDPWDAEPERPFEVETGRYDDELAGFPGGAAIAPVPPSLAAQAPTHGRADASIQQPQEPARAERRIAFSPTSRFFAEPADEPAPPPAPDRRASRSLLGLEAPAQPVAPETPAAPPAYRARGQRDEPRTDTTSGAAASPHAIDVTPALTAKASRRTPTQAQQDRSLLHDDTLDSISFETEEQPNRPAYQVESEGRRWPVPSRGLVAALGAAILLVGGFAGWQKFGPASAPAETGTVRLESLPEGADVRVDGVSHGKAPTVAALTPGEHTVDFAANGKKAHLPVTVVGGEEIVARVTLFPNGPPGRLQVTTIPQGAAVTLNGESRGATPVTVDELPPGEHTVVVENPAGRIEQRVVVPPGATVPVTLAISGWLVVQAPIELKVLEHGRALGVSGPERIMIAAGRRRIELANEELAFRDDQVVDIKAGTLTTLHARLPPGVLHLTSDKPSDVTLDGRALGRTPVMNLSVPLGMHEIMFANPSFGELQYTVVVRAGTNRLAATFRDLDPAQAAKGRPTNRR